MIMEDFSVDLSKIKSGLGLIRVAAAGHNKAKKEAAQKAGIWKEFPSYEIYGRGKANKVNKGHGGGRRSNLQKDWEAEMRRQGIL